MTLGELAWFVVGASSGVLWELIGFVVGTSSGVLWELVWFVAWRDDRKMSRRATQGRPTAKVARNFLRSVFMAKLIGICFWARPHGTERCAGEGELLFALIHCGPILPDLAEGGNRQFLPSFWRFCPIAKSVGGRQRPSGQAMREK